MAITTRRGTTKADTLISNSSDDLLLGMAGRDMLLDGGTRGMINVDRFSGDAGNDIVRTRWGMDMAEGGDGNDLLVSRSDAGEPTIAQNPALPRYNSGETLSQSNDVFTGGRGADTFLFRLDLNATEEIVAKHTAISGVIDWMGVTGENGAPHLHWVEGIGADRIMDFNRAQGDKIEIEGHTVEASLQHIDSNGDGTADMSLIKLKSNQGGAGSHDGDSLGYIRVYGDLVEWSDIMVDNMAHHGVTDDIADDVHWTNTAATAGNDMLRSTAANVTVDGGTGDDVIIDGGRQGDGDRDVLLGGDGNDVLRSRWGIDVLIGGAGDDVLVSRSDAGEPAIAQTDKVAKYEPGEPLAASNDVLKGGMGADTFYFRLDLDARDAIIKKHSEPDGHIHWHDVAGENNAAHLHWVEGIGNDAIMDFSRGQGDKILIEGHTVEAFKLEHFDRDKDGTDDMSVISLRSNQGGNGSHDKDLLGTIRVFGDLVDWADIMVDAMPAYGVAPTLDDYAVA